MKNTTNIINKAKNQEPLSPEGLTYSQHMKKAVEFETKANKRPPGSMIGEDYMRKSAHHERMVRDLKYGKGN